MKRGIDMDCLVSLTEAEADWIVRHAIPTFEDRARNAKYFRPDLNVDAAQEKNDLLDALRRKVEEAQDSQCFMGLTDVLQRYRRSVRETPYLKYPWLLDEAPLLGVKLLAERARQAERAASDLDYEEDDEGEERALFLLREALVETAVLCWRCLDWLPAPRRERVEEA